MAVTLSLEPAGRSCWDEPLSIAVHGLAPEQPVTLHAALRDEKGALFRAHARYRADARGDLDLARAPALGGSFSGIEPMGLLWAMEPERPFWRLIKRDVQTPFVVELKVLDGHDSDGGRLLARAVHERHFMAPGVRRVPVREGRVRATLFLPPGLNVCMCWGDYIRASLIVLLDEDTTSGLVTKAKATTIKEALARWEEKTGQRPSEAREIKLYAQIPPIEKMDASLSTLANCEKLSLSTNCIEKIANLNGLKNLRILSLGRNNIKNLNGLEAVGDTLEELWISYNFIEKLKGIHVMKKLKILYMSNNLVKDWAEFVKLAELPCLEDLVFVGNPLEEKHSAEGNWIDEATKRVSRLKKLDGTPVIKEDEEDES
ncbi:dynein light chain 1, axonemal isoform X2 [Mesocricetus auratus]|uniref:Dynein light chain 1, axonemal isoform X2 n=1 Tax=Mesocricetus auratus TaxID=10036 RepID=A0ABM2XCY7_MESAU|nr:dynein light chain 1, axonemal isoform X2 [Mesocricetus auratus]